MPKYNFQCLLLSGMPASGKDTLSQKLVEIEPLFVHFRKHKTDPEERSRLDDTYILVTPDGFEQIVQESGFIQYHSRYGRMYGVSRSEFLRSVSAGKIPIIHVGKYENLRQLREGGLTSGLSVLLWVDRKIAEARLKERHKHRIDSVEERLAAYDEDKAMLAEYAHRSLLDFDLVFINNESDPEVASSLLLQELQKYKADADAKRKTTNEIHKLLNF